MAVLTFFICLLMIIIHHEIDCQLSNGEVIYPQSKNDFQSTPFSTSPSTATSMTMILDSTNLIEKFELFKRCCQIGHKQVENHYNCNHGNRRKLKKIKNKITEVQSLFCDQIYNVCCQQRLAEFQCNQGIMAAMLILNFTSTSCEEQFLTLGSVSNEAYRCCIDCQFGIQIANQYNSLDYCRRISKIIQYSPLHLKNFPYISYFKSQSSFKECCRLAVNNDKNNGKIYENNEIGKEIENKTKLNTDSITNDYDIELNEDFFNDNKFIMSLPNTNGLNQCNNGFQFDPIIKACKDINECQLGTHSCAESLRCDNTIGSYLCVRIQDCGTGYTINADTYECDDIDECLLNIHRCGPDYRCRNTQGSFKCDRIRCPEGQALVNGFCRRTTCLQSEMFFDLKTGLCQPRQDPCLSNPCLLTERCLLKEDSSNEYVCVPLCPNGYRFNETEKQCIDVNECLEGIAHCGPNQLCENIEGYYKCVCQPGYELTHQRHCVDINECLHREVMIECNRQSKSCINIPGSYRCECENGYYWDDSIQKCQDRNECDHLEWNHCEQICLNTIGSYVCECHPGYRLMINKHNCTDVDECREWFTFGISTSTINVDQSFSDTTPCRGICVNQIGSYRCDCPSGFKLIQNRCVDINECNDYEQLCSHSSELYSTRKHCINLYGSYQCVDVQCSDGYLFKRTEQSIRCIWADKSKPLPSIDDYNQYEYLYYTIYHNQTSFLNGTNSMYLYTVRMDLPPPTTQFKLKLINAQWLKYPELKLFDQSMTNSNRDYYLATYEHFNLRLNSHGNEANVEIIWPLYGPQKIELELISIGFRLGFHTRQNSILTLFVSEFDRF